ncbi:MAG: toprim domain-containing protein [Robiginitomaculum sp.]|nr:toprim domain-containing protein [Robiginitomaculum sp.]
MRADILDDVRRTLIADFKFVKRGTWLQKGTCPQCSSKELFTHADSPWVIKCGRYNNCGYERHAKDLYPDLFTKFNDRYKPTMENPNATAEAYLKYARGFDLKSIKGWYRQEKYWHRHGDKGTATVRFDIDRANDVYMERLIETVVVTDKTGKRTKRKANFNGKHRGLWWQPPGMEIKDGDTVWLVEGCLDAIALNLNDVKSVATLSAVNYPALMLEKYKDKKIRWIFALDNDTTGKKYTKRHVKKAKSAEYKVGAAQIPSGQGGGKIDWNDLHQQGKLDEEYLRECLYHGDLLTAKSAFVKSMLIWKHGNASSFSFTFNNRLYWFKTEVDKLNKAIEEVSMAYPDLDPKEIRQKAIQQASMLSEICNCNPRFLYFQSHEATDESWYYCNISFPNGRPPIKTTFSGGQISSSAEFKKRLLTAAPGGLFIGGGGQLNWIIKNHLANIKQVKTIDYVGYSKDHQAYIFNEFAVKHGQYYKANADEYVEIDKLSIKTLSKTFRFEIGKSHEHNTDWPELVYQAYGVKGLIALTFWFGSLFAEQIRTTQKSFPFLEIVGEADAGKTGLIVFLWKLLGLDDTEGFDPSKATTAGRRRKFAQVSNLPIVLLEGDRDEASKYKAFDFNELKDAYNGRGIGERGIKNSGNETYAPSFKAAIVIAQNADVQGSEAVMQRLIHLKFDTERHSPAGRRASDKLDAMDVEHVSQFMLKSILNEKNILAHFNEKTRSYEDKLSENEHIKTGRIAKNHGQLMALADSMVKITNLGEDRLQEIHAHLVILAVERQRAVKADHPMLQQFWETFDFLNASNGYTRQNHSRVAGLIAINLNHFVKIATEERQQIPALTDLKPLLKQTRTHKFVGIRAVNTALGPEHKVTASTVKCWVFEKKGGA